MRRWLAAAMLLLAVSAPVSLHARGYMACVQAQLAQTGHSEPTAGQLETRTRQAAMALGRDDLPPLTEHTAYEWCKTLGQGDAALRVFWPASGADMVWIPPGYAGTGLDTVTRRALADARAYVRNVYRLELVGDFAFVVGHDAGQVEAAAKAHRHARGESAKGMFRAKPMPCGSDRSPRAVAFRDMALFCGAVGAYDAHWIAQNQTWWSRTFVHEYVHGLQYELAGVSARPRLPSGERALGPAWLVEGAAEVFEEEFYATRTRFNERSLGRHKRKTKGVGPPLADLRLRVRNTADYDVSQFAADLLGARFGRAALFAYFDAVRSADDWSGAFQKTFGMSLASYEAEFEGLRGNLVAAHEYGKAKE